VFLKNKLDDFLILDADFFSHLDCSSCIICDYRWEIYKDLCKTYSNFLIGYVSKLTLSFNMTVQMKKEYTVVH
jgi:hypothetical protein